MVVRFVKEAERFKKSLKKINKVYKLRVNKLIKKIMEYPEVGKPMRYARKGTREVYIPPLRLSYTYIKKEDKIILLDIYHKNGQ